MQLPKSCLEPIRLMRGVFRVTFYFNAAAQIELRCGAAHHLRLVPEPEGAPSGSRRVSASSVRAGVSFLPRDLQLFLLWN